MDDVARMIGYRPLPIMKWCWAVVTPMVCMVSGDMRLPVPPSRLRAAGSVLPPVAAVGMAAAG